MLMTATKIPTRTGPTAIAPNFPCAHETGMVDLRNNGSALAGGCSP